MIKSHLLSCNTKTCTFVFRKIKPNFEISKISYFKDIKNEITKAFCSLDKLKWIILYQLINVS